MSTYMISDGTYTENCNAPNVTREIGIHEVLVIEAKDATDENLLEAARKYAEWVGVCQNEVTIQRLSSPVGLLD